MLALEIKILVLTAVYFLGWFLMERIVSRFWSSDEHVGQETASTPVRRPVAPGRTAPLASITPLDQTTRYIKGLKNPDWRVRRISCVQLGDKRGSAVVQALIEALRDPREEVSLAAGEALAKIGDPTAIAALTEHVSRLEMSMSVSYERSRAA